MSYEFYISPSDYQQAQRNGVNPNALNKRVRSMAWPKEKALTLPLRQKRNMKELAKVAEQNSIPYKTMIRRMERGWGPELASTKPLVDRVEIAEKLHQVNRKYPRHVVEKALSNGVSYPTFTERMRQGWSLEEASETKTFGRGTSRGKESSPWSKEKRMVGMR